jgi:thiol-disulfide isomerase/thioredoxin
VSAHYRDADYLHVEITTASNTHSLRRDDSTTAAYSFSVAPGERYRFESEDSIGSSEMVSDGTTEWRLMKSLNEYDESPVGTFYTSRALYGGDNASLLQLRSLRLTLSGLDAGIRSAHFAADETLQENGKPVPCAVVWFNQDDTTSRPTPGSTWRKTIWIDRASLRIVKMETRSLGHPFFGPVSAANGPESQHVETTTVTRSDFNFEPKSDTFVFTPPPGVAKVASLPTGLTSPLPPNKTPDHAADHVGKPLPDVTLKDADGKEVSFSRYRGHPLLIDVWATWCGPCLSEMPALEHIRKSTSGTDLQIVGVDQDLHSSDAQAFLKGRNYDWPDFAYTVPFTKAVSLGGLPLMVLVDGQGTITYYHSGANDVKGLVAAIAKLGPAYAGVRMD